MTTNILAVVAVVVAGNVANVEVLADDVKAVAALGPTAAHSGRVFPDELRKVTSVRRRAAIVKVEVNSLVAKNVGPAARGGPFVANDHALTIRGVLQNGVISITYFRETNMNMRVDVDVPSDPWGMS